MVFLIKDDLTHHSIPEKTYFDVNQTHHLLISDVHGWPLCQETTKKIQALDLEYLAFLAADESQELTDKNASYSVEFFTKTEITREVSGLEYLFELDGVFWKNWKYATLYLFGKSEFVQSIQQAFQPQLAPSVKIIISTENN